ncbi:MAG: tetratricopeptide repeat protein [Candidatus Micrarchaeota archaeon]
MTDERTDHLIAKTECYLEEKKNKKAAQSAKDLTEIDPKDAIVWYVKGKVHYMMDEFDEALSALSRAATIDAERPEIWLVMGYTLVALRRYDEAKQSLEYVVAVQPGHVEANSAMCILSIILGDGSAAKGYFEKAMQLNKKTASKMLNYFYKNFISPSNAVNEKTKEAIEGMFKQAGIK